ncbi:hypothetical protein B0T20DRAFT_14213 [Sordaria brevicollis]|uniref:Uncharacterized protein n=1 Tax=Sordaria brevicollis TaxID=83679 RepID=A0AAE0PNX8_SORBR|nr:hypothetical protein B0T20DRAFT_14213 [Sordaria brevicollis]
MRSSSIPPVLPALLLAAPLTSAASLLGRADERYEDIVCRPAVKEGSNGPIPPCISLENIEAQCAPNGTSPLAYEAHKQCMCGGSFFTEWPLCQNCLFVHGLRSERDVDRYLSVLASASSVLCEAEATPSAIFRDIFQSVDYEVPVPTTGATGKSDQAVSKTDVSYYMTTVSQGPGKITGSALSATATGDAAPAPQTTNTGDDDDEDGGKTAVSTVRPIGTVTSAPASSAASNAPASETSSKPSSAAGVKAGLTGVVGVAAAMAVAMML